MVICYMKVMGTLKQETITKTVIWGLKTQTITRKRGMDGIRVETIRCKEWVGCSK